MHESPSKAFKMANRHKIKWKLLKTKKDIMQTHKMQLNIFLLSFSQLLSRVEGIKSCGP